MTKLMYVAGVDEAGRGPWAGSVYAAAVILDPAQPIEGLMDSKKLSEKKRAALEIQIKESALSYAIASASVSEIDQLNILQASLLAMTRALQSLQTRPDKVLIDGKQIPDCQFDCEAVIKGDSLYAQISAASILAKQARDRELYDMAMQYPQYGFERHKGYGTKLHQQALQEYGVTPIHRRSYAPIKKILAQYGG